MLKIDAYLKDLNTEINELTKSINVVSKKDIKEAVEEAKLKENTWNKVEDAVVVFSDLKNSTGISFDNSEKTMSKLLEILNKPFIEIHTKFGAEFLDIKGDGGIAIYSTENYLNAFLAAKTINTYYQRFVFKEINKRYDFKFIVETGIANGDLLVKRVGHKKNNNNFYVWSGETVNKAALISKQLKENSDKDNNKIRNTINNVGITQEIYNRILESKFSKLLEPCCENISLWYDKKLDNNNLSSPNFYYTSSLWCFTHGQEVFDELISDNDIAI